MSFRDSILKKIEINRLAAVVCASLQPRGEIQRVDKGSMRRLLELAGYEKTRRRDLELYTESGETEPKKILVLDNGLPIFHTTLDDVVLRKSPTVKEMISIRNVVKILKDDDVVASKKTATVETVRMEAIGTLDLSFTVEEIDAIRLDGAASLESGYLEGIMEVLEIYSELLGWVPPPKAFALPHHHVSGEITGGKGSASSYGPLFLFDRMHQTLKLIDRALNPSDVEEMEYYRNVVENREKAFCEGIDVFRHLMTLVIPAAGSS